MATKDWSLLSKIPPVIARAALETQKNVEENNIWKAQMTLFQILRRQIVAKIILCKIILTPLSIEKSKIYNLFVFT